MSTRSSWALNALPTGVVVIFLHPIAFERYPAPEAWFHCYNTYKIRLLELKKEASIATVLAILLPTALESEIVTRVSL